jgi:hypothetical protein
MPAVSRGFKPSGKKVRLEHAAGAPCASADVLDFRIEVQGSRKGPWQVTTPRSSCPEEESTPLPRAANFGLTAKSTL